MITLSIGGKPFSRGSLEKELMRAAFKKLCTEMQHRIGSVRHPITGEFAFATVLGHSIEDMRMHVEGSSALIEVVKRRLSEDESIAMTSNATDKKAPHVFLSYGSDDRDLAKRIAQRFTDAGIDTWWAEWEISAGDSVRQKIDQGLEGCTHFVVLLSPSSIQRPWVNAEMDAGFVKRVNATSRFIPLRFDFPVAQLPPLLSGLLCPEIDKDLTQIKSLIDDIHGLTRKPTLGEPPASAPSTGYSIAATAIAGLAVNDSANGDSHDVELEVGEIVERTKLSEEDVADALYELRAFFVERHDSWHATAKLYAEFDQFWKPWNPSEDALKLAADLVNDSGFPSRPSEIAERYGWEPRRLNPAIFFLKDRAAVDVLEHMGTHPYSAGFVNKSDATRRFVKSRS